MSVLLNGRDRSRHVIGAVSATVRHHPVVVLSTVAAATVGVGVLSVARHRRDADLELLAGTGGRDARPLDEVSRATAGAEETAP